MGFSVYMVYMLQHYVALLGFRDLTAHLLAEHPEDTRTKGGYNGTPLHASVVHGHVDTFSLLIDHFPNPDVRGRGGETPLHRLSFEAHDKGSLEIGKRLLDRGANVNACTDDDSTPLHYVALGGNPEFARFLLEHGATVNSQDDEDETPLHTAASQGHAEVVMLLLKYGADFNVYNEDGETPSASASAYGQKDIVELLAKHVAESIEQ